MNNHHHAFNYTSPLVIPTSNSRPGSPVASTSSMAFAPQQQRGPGGKRAGEEAEGWEGKRMRMDDAFRHPQQGHTAETEDIMAGIRGAFTPTSTPSIHQPHGYTQGFIPPVGFGSSSTGARGRQGMSQTPVRDGSGEDDEASEGSEEDDGLGGGRGKEEEERKRRMKTTM